MELKEKIEQFIEEWKPLNRGLKRSTAFRIKQKFESELKDLLETGMGDAWNNKPYKRSAGIIVDFEDYFNSLNLFNEIPLGE